MMMHCCQLMVSPTFGDGCISEQRGAVEQQQHSTQRIDEH